MTFEEEFPKLAEKDEFGESNAKHLELQGWSEIIQAHCLDKIKVKKAIEKSAFIEHLTKRQQAELWKCLEND